MRDHEKRTHRSTNKRYVLKSAAKPAPIKPAAGSHDYGNAGV
ncbi:MULTISPECIES: hypothetical protein [Paenibacillus]|nr:hypothetical protein [Paenibacillus sp. GbtcB18]